MSEQEVTVPKATLYWFDLSVWASVARLGFIEKGYHAEDYESRTVNLLKGENFSPAFRRLNPSATVPVLVVPLEHTVTPDVPTRYQAITDSIKILEFLDRSRTPTTIHSNGNATNGKEHNPAPALAPATMDAKALCDDLIARIHSNDIDPNFLAIAARDEVELGKVSGFAGAYLKGKLDALEKYKEEVGESDKSFYTGKIETLRGALAIYQKEATEETKAQFFAQSRSTFLAVATFLSKFEARLQTSYAIGDQISLADIHIGAWLARVLKVVGGDKIEDTEGALDLLQKEVSGTKDGQVGPKVRAYWKRLADRPSFRAVYAEGLH